jgi:hypothetical protein
MSQYSTGSNPDISGGGGEGSRTPAPLRRLAKASTSVVSALDSRKGLPETESTYASAVVIPYSFGCANRRTGSLISRRPK